MYVSYGIGHKCICIPYHLSYIELLYYSYTILYPRDNVWSFHNNKAKAEYGPTLAILNGHLGQNPPSLRTLLLQCAYHKRRCSLAVTNLFNLIAVLLYLFVH